VGVGAHMITIGHYIVVSSILFVLGVLGIFLNRKNIIVILMAIELILLAVNLNFVAFSAYLHDLTGQIFAMFVLTVAAGEAAIGLAILVIYYRGRGSIAVDDVNQMKG
jgi:NADH-quinone oxidoreductase subunit K